MDDLSSLTDWAQWWEQEILPLGDGSGRHYWGLRHGGNVVETGCAPDRDSATARCHDAYAYWSRRREERREEDDHGGD